MRNLPRFALVPFAALVTVLPLVGVTSPAGAASAEECAAAFEAQPASQIAYSSDPPARSDVLFGQPVHLSAGWDPAGWDSVSSASACVTLDGDVDETLGAASDAPGPGVYNHTFNVPEGLANGALLCTRIRVAGDPAGDATEAVWVSKTHCFEGHPEEPATTTTTLPLYVPPTTRPPATQPPPTTTTTAPAPAASSGGPGDTGTPAGDSPVDAPVTPDGDGGPVGTPFEPAGAAPSSGPGTPLEWPDTGVVPTLPATGTGAASLSLFRHGTTAFFVGLGFLVAFGLPRRRRHSTTG